MTKLLKIYIMLLFVGMLAVGCGKVQAVSSPEAEGKEQEAEAAKLPEEETETQRQKLFPIVEAGIDYLSIEGISLEPKVQIAMIASDKSNEFYSTVKAGAAQAIADLNAAHGYTGKNKITLLYDAPKKENVIDQINIIDQFLDKAPHALTIAFSDASACKTQIQMMKNNGIKLIAFDAPDEDKLAEALVSTDNKEASALAASKLFDASENRCKIAVIVHNSMKKTGEDRYHAVTQKYLAEYLHKGLRFVDIVYMNEEEGYSKEIIDGLLAENPDLGGIICTDLKTTEMVIDYARSMEEQTFQIVGFDASEKILEAVKDHTILGTVVQDAYGMGYATVVAAARSVAGMANATNIHSPYLWVDSSNLESEEAMIILSQ